MAICGKILWILLNAAMFMVQWTEAAGDNPITGKPMTEAERHNHKPVWHDDPGDLDVLMKSLR